MSCWVSGAARGAARARLLQHAPAPSRHVGGEARRAAMTVARAAPPARARQRRAQQRERHEGGRRRAAHASLAARCSAGCRAARPVVRRICSRHEVPAATARSASRIAGREPVLGDAPRQVGVAVAEGAGHAAAPGARVAHATPGRSAPARRRPRGRRRARAAWQWSCTTASRGVVAQRRRRRGRAPPARRSTAASATQRGAGVAGHEAREVVDQHRPARGLEHHDRPPGDGVRGQPVERPRARVARAGAHQALRQQRAAAAAGIDDAARAAPAAPSTRRAASPMPGSRKRVKVSAISTTVAPPRGRAGLGASAAPARAGRSPSDALGDGRPPSAREARRARPERQQRVGVAGEPGREGHARARGGGGRGPRP